MSFFKLRNAYQKPDVLMRLLRRFAPRKKNPPDRNRGEQLKTQAVNRLVEVIQEDWDLIYQRLF